MSRSVGCLTGFTVVGGVGVVGRGAGTVTCGGRGGAVVVVFGGLAAGTVGCVVGVVSGTRTDANCAGAGGGSTATASAVDGVRTGSPVTGVAAGPAPGGGPESAPGRATGVCGTGPPAGRVVVPEGRWPRDRGADTLPVDGLTPPSAIAISARASTSAPTHVTNEIARRKRRWKSPCCTACPNSRPEVTNLAPEQYRHAPRNLERLPERRRTGRNRSSGRGHREIRMRPARRRGPGRSAAAPAWPTRA